MSSTIDYTKLVTTIIRHQEEIIGPLAWVEANHVNGLEISEHNVQVVGEGKEILDSLVKQYATLFGKASIEVCKDAIKKSGIGTDTNILPSILAK